jgi:hypothetical protein
MSVNKYKAKSDDKVVFFLSYGVLAKVVGSRSIAQKNKVVTAERRKCIGSEDRVRAVLSPFWE